MAKQVLTDRMLAGLKPAEQGQRRDYMDAVVPGFGVRVTDKADEKGRAANRTFILLARFPGSNNPTRRSLGGYPLLSLESARNKAREWLELVQKGIDPAEAEARQRAERYQAIEAAAEEEKRKEAAAKIRASLTFGVAIEEYFTRHLKGQRTAHQTERDIRRELLPLWKERPIDEITRADVVAVIEAISDRPAPYMARQIFSHIRTFFNWAINRGAYPGLNASPCDRLSPSKLVGAAKARKRVLTDEELFAYWRAAGRLGYPFGPLFRLLALTGGRRDEIADMQGAELHPQIARLLRSRKDGEAIDWRQVDDAIKLLTVPPERFKGETPHLIPLTRGALQIMETLPIFSGGDYLLSSTFGERPISGFSKAKARLDGLMLLTLKALARLRTEDPRHLQMKPFVNHDLRRTLRTRLSALRVPENVAELIVGHSKKGMVRVYDQHHFLDEMREALEKWASLLAKIVSSPDLSYLKSQKRSGQDAG
jgi:integrase